MAVPVKIHFPRTSGARSWVDTFYRPLEPKGNIFYVHSSGAGSTTGGRSPEDAVTTIDAAINLCTANNHDHIIVLAGHTEALTAAAAVALDVAGVTIIGEGVGRERPVITYTTVAGASFDISAADCLVKNIVFSAVGVAAVTAAVNISAADVWIIDCDFQLANATNQAALGILTTASADRMRVQGCHFYGTTAAGTVSDIKIVGGTDIIIKDNIMVGACATTGNIATATTDSLNLQIIGNFILNQTADANNKAIVLTSSTTGLIANNRMAVIDSTSPAPVTAAGAYVSGNYSTGAAGVTASTLM